MDRRGLVQSVGFVVADGRRRSGGNSMHPRGSARDHHRIRGRVGTSPSAATDSRWMTWPCR
jgi:hypothetical protein